MYYHHNLYKTESFWRLFEVLSKTKHCMSWCLMALWIQGIDVSLRDICTTNIVHNPYVCGPDMSMKGFRLSTLNGSLCNTKTCPKTLNARAKQPKISSILWHFKSPHVWFLKLLSLPWNQIRTLLDSICCMQAK